jgi:hypothetical protein
MLLKRDKTVWTSGRISGLIQTSNPNNQKIESMPTKLLGKLLFPRLPAWQARRQARHLLAAVSVALALGCVIAGVILYQGFKH